MRKVKLSIAFLTLLAGPAIAVAFNERSTTPDLYYYNSNKACVAAPCQTANRTAKACLFTVYTDSNCQTPYTGKVFTSD